LGRASELSKNEIAWDKLFAKYRILENIKRYGIFVITAVQIREYREARLMTKFDHKVNLPRLFSDNNLAILPITRGRYVISNFEAYKDFPAINKEVIRVSIPTHIESLDYQNITSEATAINCAYSANILADFSEDENLIPTVNGRMGSGAFSFQINNIINNTEFEIDVVNSQIEIDGGYEGQNQLVLIEAKNYIADDFLIRQLYYPYRLWRDKVKKRITPVFLMYSNGIFSLYEYEFQEPLNYNSLVLVKQKNYTIEPVEISLDDIVRILTKVAIVVEPSVPFPQADNFRRVINLCELLSQGEMSKDDITLNYAFDPRQTNYYADAGRYLGFIDKRREENEVVFFLTEEGRKIFLENYRERQLKFVEAILSHKVFNELYRLYLNQTEPPAKRDIVKIMKQSNLYQVQAESTYERRASTVIGWINWILGLYRETL
jgi:hypothetical protein